MRAEATQPALALPVQGVGQSRSNPLQCSEFRVASARMAAVLAAPSSSVRRTHNSPRTSARKQRRANTRGGALACTALMRELSMSARVSQTAMFEDAGARGLVQERDEASLRSWIESSADEEFDEYDAAEMMANIGFSLPAHDLKAIFAAVDTDRSGTLDREELHALLAVYREQGWSHHMDGYGGVGYHANSQGRAAGEIVWEGDERGAADDWSISEDGEEEEEEGGGLRALAHGGAAAAVTSAWEHVPIEAAVGVEAAPPPAVSSSIADSSIGAAGGEGGEGEGPHFFTPPPPDESTWVGL